MIFLLLLLWQDLVGVKPTAPGSLVAIKETVDDSKIFFRVLSPKGLEYDMYVESGTFRFYAAMPNEDIVLLYGKISDQQIFTPEEIRITAQASIQPSTPQISVTDKEVVRRSFEKALQATDSQDLINQAFAGLRPIVQKNPEIWTEYLNKLRKDFEAENHPKSDLRYYKEKIRKIMGEYR
jgi:hypothetical protein